MTKTGATHHIRLHGPDAFAAMRRAGQLTALALDEVTPLVREGTTTQEIDDFFMDFAASHHALPATLNYRGYRKACCTSINHVVCHGIPNEKPLRNGEIVNIDVTLIVDGWHGDSSRMYAVGNIPRAAARLIDVTFESMWRGINEVKPGAHLGDVGHAIQTYAEAERCSVVRDFCGHGLGQVFHDHPNVLHYGKRGEGVVLKPGMFFTIEPMINSGVWNDVTWPDNWTSATRDGKRSAQFEHTMVVTDTGVDILTNWVDGTPFFLKQLAQWGMAPA